MSAAFGTTSLPIPPTSGHATGQVWSVTYDPHSASADAGLQYQQPVQQQIAKINAENVVGAVHGASGIAVNPRFVVYVVKQGLIRVFHRHSSGSSLMRSHSGQTVSDLQFFNDGDVLASVGYWNGATANSNGANPIRGGNVVISRIFERAASEIVTEQILEIRSDVSYLTRVVWHPFNVNQFWMMHYHDATDTSQDAPKTTATLVESTRLSTAPHNEHHHAVADFATSTVLTEGGIVSPLDAGLMDLAWSTRDSRYVLAAYKTGDIVLFDVKNTTLQQRTVAGPNGSVTIVAAVPAIVQRMHQGRAVTRCVFLPHEHIDPSRHTSFPAAPKAPWTTCFVTGCDGNAELTLWSPFTESSPPVPLQVVRIAAPHPTSYVVNLCVGTNSSATSASALSCFLVLGNCDQGSIYALHLSAASNSEQTQRHPSALVLAGADYVVPFRTQFPIYSSKCVSEPPTDLADEEWSQQGRMGNMFDVSVFAYQSAAVQRLTLTAHQCWPPGASATLGVTAAWANLEKPATLNTATSDLGDDDDFEEYDVEEDEDEEDFDGAPDPSMLPVPGSASSTSAEPHLQNNAFANWLGAMAAKTPTAPAPLPLAPQVMLPPEPVRPIPPSVVSPPPPRGVSAPPASFLSPMDMLASQPPPPPGMAAALDGFDRRQNAPQAAVESNGSADTTVRGQSLGPSGGAVSTSRVELEDIRRLLQEEIQTTMVPLVGEIIRATLAKSIGSAVADVVLPVQASIDSLVKKGVTTDSDKIAAGVASSVQEQVQTALSDNVKTVLIPTLESVTSQILHQTACHLEKTNLGEDSKLESISKQLSTMTQLVVELTKEVSSLRSMVVESRTVAEPLPAAPLSNGPQPPSQPPRPTPVVDPVEMQRAEILALLKDGNFEQAFRTAVSNQTVEMTVFCCQNADMQQVFGGVGGQQVLLSQPILLCLMQQLGTVIVTSPSPQLELDWLQEISLSLNPTDLSIQRHVPGVLQQVATSINQRLTQNGANTDPALRRPLQRMLQVVRGMQMG